MDKINKKLRSKNGMLKSLGVVRKDAIAK